MRIGIDLGGTKIEGVVLDADSQILARRRVPTPPDDYQAALSTIVELVTALEQDVGCTGLTVGAGTPGARSKVNGRMKNCNSTCLNGQPLLEDLTARLGPRVRIANDADCLTLSEASDGAAAGARCVFGAILGTGVGGGIVVDGRLLSGPNAIAGEWGHNPMPWPRPEWDEVPGPLGWDGRHGTIEVYCCGPGLALDHQRVTGELLKGEDIVARASAGDDACEASLQRWEDRLARAFSTVINLLDPDVIVVGGGLSRVQRIYRNVPQRWAPWVFSDRIETRLVPAMHGDSSGVRGAAWLWPEAI
ncbi:ROK family protein [Sinimarinibacterium sp. CAU 1509]|uniref:ROK family protein n=1 Tax=Sinimarinibacterium sp. CAU 1509 TaxID=2562283 RepID=UPI0010ABD74C|nr:ROK family protein [Sinimarinibacterium sp. CAU 1509]TJY65114.1 ROK family protein [Sinimarinibacterium sp. CAU 1509]